jgi:hypothetical protein
MGNYYLKKNNNWDFFYNKLIKYVNKHNCLPLHDNKLRIWFDDNEKIYTNQLKKRRTTSITNSNKYNKIDKWFFLIDIIKKTSFENEQYILRFNKLEELKDFIYINSKLPDLTSDLSKWMIQQYSNISINNLYLNDSFFIDKWNEFINSLNDEYKTQLNSYYEQTLKFSLVKN